MKKTPDTRAGREMKSEFQKYASGGNGALDRARSALKVAKITAQNSKSHSGPVRGTQTATAVPRSSGSSNRSINPKAMVPNTRTKQAQAPTPTHSVSPALIGNKPSGWAMTHEKIQEGPERYRTKSKR